MSASIGSTIEQDTCSIQVVNVGTNTITVRYEGLPGNQPKDYGNFVAVWESTTIPWNVVPVRIAPVPQNSESGDFVIGGLTITANAYIVGYGVGPAITDICTCAFISPIVSLAATKPVTVSMTLLHVDINSLSVQYFTLPGYLPGYYRNWIGIWEGYASPYNAVQPIGFTNITSNANQGAVGIDHLTLYPGTVYTLVYFMGAMDQNCQYPKILKNAAAILYFETPPATI
ncbi:hypothetical protein [Chitinophaga agri]|uniref:Uncharacterized protein n=1 Tax=Chitinophaga agri TaxID=2703787 RepID=A0A6B9ZPQ6_9BACT|nr:hypothetical protein [Chitinophaga agri]QHS63651.1 hypothetical protein GWR21_29940 [Chitinophaga agri]